MDRRKYLAVVAAGIAGCSSSPGDETPDPTPEASPTPSDGVEPTPDATPGDEATPTPDEEPVAPGVEPSVDRQAIVYHWQRLRGFEGGLGPDAEVARGHTLGTWFSVSLPIADGGYDGSVAVRATSDGAELLTTDRQYAGSVGDGDGDGAAGLDDRATIEDVGDERVTLRDYVEFGTRDAASGQLDVRVEATDAGSGATTAETATVSVVRESGNGQVARALENGRLRIATAVETLQTRAGSDLAAITAEDAVETLGVTDHVLAADRILREVSPPERLRSAFAAARAEAALVGWIVRAQRHAFEAVPRSRRLYADLGGVTSERHRSLQRLGETVEAVRERVESGSESVTGRFSAVGDAPTVIDYGPTISRFHEELDAFDVWHAQGRRTRDAIEHLQASNRAFDEGRFEKARDAADRAAGVFQDVVATLEGVDVLRDTTDHHVAQVQKLEADALFLKRRAIQ